jgi:Asp-tRNA(Asn)/Glu-tRNA(Gln) amidotransferase A subunit family amidase
MKLVGTAPSLPFSLETESVKSLQARLAAGTLTSETLTRAYLARIALANAEGPAIQAVRDLNTHAVEDAKTLDAERATSGARGPLHGIPVLLDDVIDVHGLPTTGGSIALQHSLPNADAALVAKLKAAGAIILGKTNVTELNGLFDANLPEGYSSLGGQVLLPSDTDKTPAGSSAGSAAATAAGLAALTVGLESSTDTAQLISPAGVAGVVGLKPTVGLVSSDGVLPVAKSQDSPGPITRTVYDAATALEALTGGSYVPSLSTSLTGKRIGVIASTTAPYPAVVTALQSLGATTVTKTIGTPSPNPPSIVTREFRRDLNAYLGGTSGGAGSLQGIINYNASHAVEGLKYQQRELLDAESPDLTNYEADKAAGQASNRALIDALLADTDVIAVPSGNALVNIADRAGYPVLTVPAGYGTAGAGRNPIGVTFVAGANGEAKLLAAGYAYEQASNVRLAPSWTNPSMWRCVPGSTFFSPHHCHPGDLQSDTAFGPTEYPVVTDVGGTVPATLSLTLGAPASFGAFVPGVAKIYTAQTTANVISTAGEAKLTVSDPGHLSNGGYALPAALGVQIAPAAWTGPVSNATAAITFTQAIGSNDALRTGSYNRTLTFTLSTTQP